MSTLRLIFCAAALAAFGSHADANALCKGKPRLELSDGAKACLLRNDLTEITSTRSIVGGGPATVLKSKMQGAVVSIAMINEATARGVTGRKIRARAKEVCQRFAPELLAKVDRPGNPFMAVEFVWGNKIDRITILTDKERYRELYLTRQCWVRKGG